MKKIPLTHGKFALVDDEDFEFLNQWKWHTVKAPNTFYVRRNESRRNDGARSIKMHRLILGLTDSKILCDHINGDGLDNQRYNLRICTQAENGRNRGKNRKNTSGFKGVSWHKEKNRWTAEIKVDRKKIRLGYFDCKIEAARAYDEAAEKYHGRFSRPNFDNNLTAFENQKSDQ